MGIKVHGGNHMVHRISSCHQRNATPIIVPLFQVIGLSFPFYEKPTDIDAVIPLQQLIKRIRSLGYTVQAFRMDMLTWMDVPRDRYLQIHAPI